MEVVLHDQVAETAKTTEEMVNTEPESQQHELEQVKKMQQQQQQQQQSKQLSIKLEQLQEYRRHHSEVFQNNNVSDDNNNNNNNNNNNEQYELNQSSMYFQPSHKEGDHLDNHESEQGTESFLGRKTYSCSGITSIEQSLNQQKNNAIISEKEYPRHVLQWREGDVDGEDQEKEQFYRNENQDILKQLREFLASDSIHATLSELHSKTNLMASYSQKQQFLLANKHFNPKTYFSAHPISAAEFTSMLEIEDTKPSGEPPVQILKKHCTLQSNSSSSSAGGAAAVAGQVKKSSVSFNLSNLQENTVTIESQNSHKNSINRNNTNKTITSDTPICAVRNSKQQSNTLSNISNAPHQNSAVVSFADDVDVAAAAVPPIKTAGLAQVVLHPREIFQSEGDSNSSIGYLSSILTLKNPKQSPKLFNVETPYSVGNNNIILNNNNNIAQNTASLFGVNSTSLHKLDVSGLSAISVNSPMPAGYDSTPFKKEPFSISELSLLGRSATNHNNNISNPNSNSKQPNNICSEQIANSSTGKQYNGIVSLPSSPRNCSNNTGNTTHCVHGMNNQITTSSISNSSSSNNILKGISITLFSADRQSAVTAAGGGNAKEGINTLTQTDYSQGLKNQSAKVEEQIPSIIAGSTIAKLLSPVQFYKPKTNHNNNKSIVTVSIPSNCTLNATNTNKHSSRDNLNKTSVNPMNDKSLIVQKQNKNQRLSMQTSQSSGSKSISIHLMNTTQQDCCEKEKSLKMQELLSQLKDKKSTKCDENSAALSPGIRMKNSINNIQQIRKDMETQPSLASLVFRSSFSSQTKSLTNSKNPSPSGRKRPSVNSINKIIFSSKVSPSSSPRFNSSNTTVNNTTNLANNNNNNNHSSLPNGNIINHHPPAAPLNPPYLGIITKGKTYSLYANQRSNSKIKVPYASPKNHSRSIHNSNNPFNQCSSSSSSNSKTFVGGDCGLNPDSFKFHTTNNSRNPSFESKFNPAPQKLFSSSFKGLIDFHENDSYPMENADDFKEDRQSNQLIGTKRLAKTLQVLSVKDVRERNSKIALGLRSINSSISQLKKPMTAASSPKKQQQQIISKDNSRVASPVAACNNNNNNMRDRKQQNQKNSNNIIDCSPMAGDRFLRKDRIARQIPLKNNKNALFSPQLSQKYIDMYTEMELLNMRMNAVAAADSGGHHSNNVSFSNGLMQQQVECNLQGGVQQIDSGSFSRRKEADGDRV